MITIADDMLEDMEEIKRHKGWSNAELGKLFGVSGATVGRWLSGKTKRMQSTQWKTFLEEIGEDEEHYRLGRIEASLSALGSGDGPDAVVSRLVEGIVMAPTDFIEMRKRLAKVEYRGKVVREKVAPDAPAIPIVFKEGVLRDGDAVMVMAGGKAVFGTLRVIHVLVEDVSIAAQHQG